jgi:hypothetical protein
LKNFIPTPECKLLPKSGRAILERFSQLIETAHSENPNEFSVYNEVLDRGFLRSVVIQTAKNRNGNQENLLTVVTATNAITKFRSLLKSKVADRLMADFPDQLKGVVLVEARLDAKRDPEFFDNPDSVQVLVGQGELSQYIPSADREIRVLPSSPSWVGSEQLMDSISQELTACIGDSQERVMEIFSSKDQSVTDVLRSISDRVEILGTNKVLHGPIGGLENVRTRLIGSTELLPKPVEDKPANLTQTPSEAITIENADRLVPPAMAGKMPSRFDGTVVLSFPRNDEGKPEIKGVTSKKFRHWLGNVVRPKRIVIVTESWDGLRKDIGHMKLLGYEIRRIKAYDTQPGRMDKLLIIVMMEMRPGYKPLDEGQLLD